MMNERISARHQSRQRRHAGIVARPTTAAIDGVGAVSPSNAGGGRIVVMVLNSAKVAENEKRLDRFLQLFQIVPFDAAAAKEYGQVRTDLRRAGRPIPQIDAQIAAIARVHQMIVLSADQRFRHVPNTMQENWLAPAP